MNVHSKQAQTVSEQDQHEYDSTQRAVGALVLFSLMMILYFILKAVLGISETGVEYALSAPAPLTAIERNSQNTALPAIPQADAEQIQTFNNKFVFLNLQGLPMNTGESANNGTVNSSAYAATPNNSVITEEQWYIQTASFKNKSAADKMVKRLRANQFDAYNVKSGEWYAVRLQAQTNRLAVTKELRRLKKTLRISGVLRHLKPN